MNQTHPCPAADTHTHAHGFDVAEHPPHCQATHATLLEAPTVWGWLHAQPTSVFAANVAGRVQGESEPPTAVATLMQSGCSASGRPGAAMTVADPDDELAVDSISGDIVVAFDGDRSGCDRQQRQMTALGVQETPA